MALAPKTKNSDHVFYNTNVFGSNELIAWFDGSFAVLTHTINNCKIHIDASHDPMIRTWRNSPISYRDISIENSKISFGVGNKDFATYFNDNDTVNVILEFNSPQNRRIVTYIDSDNVSHPLSKYDGSERSDITFANKYTNYVYSNGQLKISAKSLSTWQAAAVSSITLNIPVNNGSVNQVLNVSVTVKDSNTFGVESAPVTFFIESGRQQQIIHSHGLYSLTNVAGLASAQIVLKSEGICRIKAYVGSPNELISSAYEILCGVDETEIYLRGVTYQTKSFIDDYKLVYQRLTDIFLEIPNFTWSEIGFSQSDVLKSNDSVVNQMVVFVKGATFNSTVYLSLQQSLDLRTAIANALIIDGDFTCSDIEIRTYKRFVNI
jgi:hypothetical protein